MSFEWPVILAMVATLAAAATIWWSRRSQATSGTGRNDRYASEEVISRAQHKLYDYLQEAFPGQVVLYAQPLSRLVSVRFAENRQRAQQRLQDHVVDFVVCSADGKPQFAFQVDAYRADDAEAARRDAAVKHRVLATAGIRLLRLKKSVRHLPEPAEFGQRLLNVLPGAAADSDAAALSASPRPNRVPVLTQEVRMGRGGRLESESMSLTGLMGLPQTQR
jgi:hypothetical protein